jgi:hypothetical protein
MLANVNLVRDLELIAKHGRIIVVGNRGALELNPRLIMRRMPSSKASRTGTRVAGRTGQRARRDCGRHGAIPDGSRRSEGTAAGRRAPRGTRRSLKRAHTEKLS